MATLALAQDNAFGQPLESQLRSCLLATWICEAAGFDEELRETVYWVALLRYVGCTGHAHEVATVFGDEIAIRAQTLVHDAANPAEVMRDVMAYATAGHTPEERDEIVRMIQETAREWAVYNFSSGCEVADVLVERLDFGPDVREALRFTFERWNGNGYPAHAKGEAIPLAMRVVHLSHDMEAIGRLFSPEHALDAARDRRDATYDPALADLFIEHGGGWFDRLAEIEPWDAVLALEPEPHRMLAGAELDDALTVVADFIDLKSPYMGGHSRRCADLADRRGAGARARRRLRRRAPPRGARPRLRHDDRPELDLGQARPAHALGVRPRRAASDADRADAAPLAGSRHPEPGRVHTPREGRRIGIPQARAGRRRRSRRMRPGGDGDLRGADHRASRPAGVPARRGGDRAAPARVRGRGRAARQPGGAGGRGTRRAARTPTGKRPQNPGGLTRREVDVLRLAARGHTTREIADRLFISPKTADHHIQHIYGKIGVSTRAAAALWAMQHTVVQ